MQWIDWLIVLLYLALSMILGLYLTRKASGSMVDFFVSGRSLPINCIGIGYAMLAMSVWVLHETRCHSGRTLVQGQGWIALALSGLSGE